MGEDWRDILFLQDGTTYANGVTVADGAPLNNENFGVTKRIAAPPVLARFHFHEVPPHAVGSY
jgi:hypothetical protein